MQRGEEVLKVYAEALLFASDKPVPLKILMNVMGVRSMKKAKEVMARLMEEYRSRHGAVEIVELAGEKYFMRLRPDLTEAVRRYVSRRVLTHGVLRTLSLIAYYQPVERSTIVSVRGKDAYRQIKILVERGLVEAEKTGKTQVLRTTQLFAELLGVENNPQAIKRMITKLASAKRSGEQS
ncbi:MAG TPA: SMC-Scp complex subunit ScpB [Aigarchaeota archaeon]|nr:SMC-Scp complex subunit ScpB [Aigarchaeota archaeon]